tara:strand:+ start:953 stop:1105 length:153 start_codon:yes stop_codon:yes gene_type:complete
VLAGHEKNVSEAQIVKIFGLSDNLRNCKSGSKDRIVTRKSAILAVIYALV